jgi:hypothetical protein
MLAGAVSDSLAQLDQVRLPLQILLESPFGELNDNQEELLRDARAAADALDGALRRLSQLADVDREAFQVQRELVQINDVVRSVLPLARAAAERRGARTETALEPGLPRVMADRARLAESLALFVTDAADSTSASQPLSISTPRDGTSAIIRIAPASAPANGEADSRKSEKTSRTVTLGTEEKEARTAAFILASRLIEAQAGTVGLDSGTLELRIG